jgi:hypothetical protein
MCALSARRIREELRLFVSCERTVTICFAALQLMLQATLRTEALP